MKKFIYTVSFIAIALVFTGTSALAQSVIKIDANIPFDFTIGDESFAAGKYVMRLQRAGSGVDRLEIRDAKYRVVYESFLAQNGDEARDKPELIFERIGGQAVLAKIRLDNKGLDVPVEKNANTTVAAKERKRLGGSSN